MPSLRKNHANKKNQGCISGAVVGLDVNPYLLSLVSLLARLVLYSLSTWIPRVKDIHSLIKMAFKQQSIQLLTSLVVFLFALRHVSHSHLGGMPPHDYQEDPHRGPRPRI